MKKAFLVGIVACGLVAFGAFRASADTAAPAAAANAQSALPIIQKTVDQVVQVAQTMAGKDHTKERRAQLREIINPHFDFDKMAQLCLGSNWTDLTPEQQKEFTDTFAELLARTYLGKIETVKPGMVKIDSEQLDYPRSMVRTLITSKGDVFPLEYRLYNKDGKWLVYDVVIENIGLVANYRNEFAGIIRKEHFDGLMTRLKEKNAAAEKEGL